jgi:RNA polymerase sigma-70 factor (ECF subfamily)
MAIPNDDTQLIRLALNGDMACFKALVEKHESKVAGIVKSMLGDTPEALDVGQEVFIRFYESMNNFRGQAALGTYLGRIAINLSLNELNRRKKRAHVFEPLEAASGVSADFAAEDDHWQLVKQEIERLEPEFKAVVTLRIIEGYSTEETAAMLGVPLGTVLSRLSRAQKKLKLVLSNTDRT